MNVKAMIIDLLWAVGVFFAVVVGLATAAVIIGAAVHFGWGIGWELGG
jgi:hypothetical protein